ncbi:PAS domain-containing sensor histidine kinase [Lacibacter sp. H407]|uniref:PAS domain-containing sensor histidine kinase n=1 Tax=Lacibacter sp. H407 TaxID=3133423 RepID=UPI0030C31E56
MNDQQLHPSATQGRTTNSNSKSTIATTTVREILTNGFIAVDQNWNVIEWNTAAEKLLRVEAKNIIGHNFWKTFSGLLPVEFYANYYKAFQLETPVRFEEYWAEMGAWFQGVVYPQGKTISISFTCSSQPANPEQKLKVLRDLYLFVTEVTNDCLWEWDLQAKQLFWIDGGHKRIFGYPIENAIIPQSYWESRIHPDDSNGLLSRLQTILTTGTEEKWEDEYRLRKMDGSYAIVHDCGHIFYNENNVAMRMIGATQDITARKKSEQLLLASEQKLSLIAKQTVNAVIVTDAEQHITWVNDAFTKITGYSKDEAVGQVPGHFLQGKETNAEVVAALNEKIKNQQPFDCKLINYTKAGEKFWVHLEGQALFDEQGNCNQFFAIQADITETMELELKLIEERITRQREITGAVISAQETERAEIGKELHDNLNQLLAVAKLYIQMAKKSESKRDQYLDRSCDLIKNVIDEVRRISKALVVPGMHEIGVLENIQNLINDLSDIHPVKFTFYKDENLHTLIDKKIQLTIFRIVQEQVANILKHANATRANIDLTLHDGQVFLHISDDGDGFDHQHPVNGVGILNIKSRVHVNHGSMQITSSPGNGFTLDVSLPLHYSPKD